MRSHRPCVTADATRLKFFRDQSLLTSSATLFSCATGLAAFVAAGGLSVYAADLAIDELPAPFAGKVEYRQDILPILEKACFRCHGPEKPKSGFRLDNRASALAGGENGPAIVLGKSADSPLIHAVARLDRDMAMPPTGKGEPLKPYELALLRAWIDQELDYGGVDQPERARLSFEMTTGAGYIAVSGDRAKFREQSWLNDGWSGGVSEFSAQGPLDEQTRFTLDGRVLLEQNDARFRFDVRRKEWGGFAGGVETRRKWSDDSGGYHPALTPPQFATGEEPYLDFGRAWFDLYLDRESWLAMRLGYELQFRDGTEATTRWGVATDSAVGARALIPSTETVDEQTHILKFDIAKDFSGWRLADSLRVEWHDQDYALHAENFGASPTAPTATSDVREGYEHTQGANSLTVEKSLRDDLVITAGYLYSWLDGAASFDSGEFLSDTVGDFYNQFRTSNRIVLDQQANVGSLGVRLGPWQEVVLFGGVQGDWSRQRGFSDVTQRYGSPTASPAEYLSWSDLERQLIEERAGLRFTGLPFTTLYAEGRWQQEAVDQYEDQYEASFPQFPTLDRGTAADARLDQYRFGGNTSPWRSVMLAAHYEISGHQTDYSPTPDDASYGPLGFGYPNFITGRQIDSDEIETSLTARLSSRLKTKLTYQFNQADYETRHQALFDGTPGGTITAGQQDANIFSAGLNWMPAARLGFDFTGSLADTELTTFANNSPSVVPYDGEVWSLLAAMNWSVDDLTRFNTTYVWSFADYRQENFTAGLPLGIEYQWHQLRASVDRQLNTQLSVTLLYLFQLYDEPTAGGFNDYTANGVFAGLTWRWRE